MSHETMDGTVSLGIAVAFAIAPIVVYGLTEVVVISVLFGTIAGLWIAFGAFLVLSVVHDGITIK